MSLLPNNSIREIKKQVNDLEIEFNLLQNKLKKRTSDLAQAHKEIDRLKKQLKEQGGDK